MYTLMSVDDPAVLTHADLDLAAGILLRAIVHEGTLPRVGIALEHQKGSAAARVYEGIVEKIWNPKYDQIKPTKYENCADTFSGDRYHEYQPCSIKIKKLVHLYKNNGVHKVYLKKPFQPMLVIITPWRPKFSPTSSKMNILNSNSTKEGCKNA